ncbi:class I SAM-dependent methyltransferase [uncultured Salinisphaera sp.]|uniref:class I SAM-dependent methyltransferase n=1 Tax=uncultured Salinisphaera sp. TaxID=359372 RepID=UPI0032B24EFF
MKSAHRQAIDLAGFEAKFRAGPDPWHTFTARDEAIKRQRILRALGHGPMARILELGSGNGSNSQALARRALKLHACDGSPSATRLTRDALANAPHAHAWQIALPARLPGTRYEAVVIAELLYYLEPRAMQRLARDVAAVLPPGARLVLAHHQIEFPDNTQRTAGIHKSFIHALGRPLKRVRTFRAQRWRVDGYRL